MTITLDAGWLGLIVAVAGQAAMAIWIFSQLHAKQKSHERRLEGLEVTFKEEREQRALQQRSFADQISKIEIAVAKVETCLQSIDIHIKQVVAGYAPMAAAQRQQRKAS